MKSKKWIMFILLAVVMVGGCRKGRETKDQQIQTAGMTQTGGEESEAPGDDTAQYVDTPERTEALSSETTSKENSAANAVKSSSSKKEDEKDETAADGSSTKKDTETDARNSGKNKSGTTADSNTKTNGSANADSSDKGSNSSGQAAADGKNVQTGKEDPSSAHTSCAWDSGKVTKEPACNAQGQKVYTCTVCGAAKTENIPYSSHHVVTETTEPTCTEAGKSRTYCSDCGSIQAETAGAAATGHSMTTQWFGEPPTCTRGGYQSVVCSRCGWVDADACGDVPPLGHDTVGREIQHGNCRDYTVIEYTCSRCGELVSIDRHNEPDEHEWVWKEDSVWDDETFGFVTIRVECCERCNARP